MKPAGGGGMGPDEGLAGGGGGQGGGGGAAGAGGGHGGGGGVESDLLGVEVAPGTVGGRSEMPDTKKKTK